ncbi:PREDICTED: uncharacterized protein LOC106100400 [Papilio polytes]|uniref:uncharacterized protein LOC106100400 n=1 Tax=Papilio polytes TaxID=76194 RepID=UPI00067632A3|nr:PREDICTED: uncharacterized protein LOC106100400 [Papilio polytes]
MEYDIINTTSGIDIIGSTYADIYIKYDKKVKPRVEKTEQKVKVPKQSDSAEEIWTSPSDLLIGKIQMQPPFTSKIIKSKTHEGIIHIGDDVLQKEYEEFLLSLKKLLRENDDCWKFVLMNESEEIYKRVKIKYQNIFKTKSALMTKEMYIFYENTLKELEEHVKNEVETVLTSVYAKIISYLNDQIYLKLRKERKKLEDTLNKKYLTEIKKIKRYYALLLRNEHEKSNQLTNYALRKRNNAIEMFYKQIICERLTSSIYVLCTERKKCKIKNIIIEKYHTAEINKVVEKIKQKTDLLQSLKEKDVCILDINKDWEGKIKKVLQLFLKFISFALKLLPEQTTFLLQLEKLVQLQLEDVKESDKSNSSILVEESNVFKFEQSGPSVEICTKEPFVIEGDTSDTPPIVYGSRETIPLDVDLPYFRLQRQFIYAKCHGFEEIKKFLDSQRCKCREQPEPQPVMSSTTSKVQSVKSSTSESSDESFLFEDFHRLPDCPVQKCTGSLLTNYFPYLNSYFDFTEENFRRVEAIFGTPYKKEGKETLLDAKDIVNSELPFAETKEKFHNIETQCSSDEDVRYDPPCPCLHNMLKASTGNETVSDFFQKSVGDTCIKRQKMLKEIAKRYPKLKKIFAEHGIDLETYV